MTTELIALFDDDDLMLEDHIPRLWQRVRDGAEICSTGYWLADPDPADITRPLRGRGRFIPGTHGSATSSRVSSP